MSRHTLTTEWCLDGANDVGIVIEYDFIPGQREQGPTYSCGGQPAEPAECEVNGVMVDGRAATAEEFDKVATSDALWQKMVDNVEGF